MPVSRCLWPTHSLT